MQLVLIAMTDVKILAHAKYACQYIKTEFINFSTVLF